MKVCWKEHGTEADSRRPRSDKWLFCDNAIHYLLMTQFAREPAFEDVTTASGSFVPSGGGYFHDETSLSTEFRAFLRTQYGIVRNKKDQ